MNPAVRIHLKEVILHGLAPPDRQRASESLVRELTRLLTEYGIPAPWFRGGSAARLDAGSFNLESESRAEQYGVRVAQAVYHSLGGRMDA